MIKVNIYRTDEGQIKAKGRNAWTNMVFKSGHITVEAIRDYCEKLAEGDGIINPMIEIIES